MNLALTVKKIKAHPNFRDEPERRQHELAEEFSDNHQIKGKFDHLLDIGEQLSATLDDNDVEYMHSLERDGARQRQKHEVAQACHLPVKLFLSKLSRGAPPLAGPLTSLLRFEYGPLHAGLIVGDVSIEWGDSSLIIPQPAPQIAGDFQAHCHEGGQWERRTGELVKDMSLANRRNSDTHTKLNVLYRSRDEKEQLIDRLVRVIVEYNTIKKYNVWSCNCQQFAIDAMSALGIQEPPKFKGRLNDYLQRLKGGKSVIEFRTHEDLDGYVKSNLVKLDKFDKEYFLCLYFQFHLSKYNNLSPEEIQVWECPIPTCQCSELENMVAEQALMFHQFRRSWEPTSRVVAKPSLPRVPEHVVAKPSLPRVPEQVDEVDDGFPYRRFMGKQECMVEHRTKLLQSSGYSQTIISKLRSCQGYNQLTEEEIQELGEVLTEKERFRQKYLSSHIDDTSKDVVFEASMDSDLTGTLTARDSRRRSDERFEKILNPTVQLVYIYEERVRGENALHTVIQVGDYLYDWDDKSVVVPKEVCDKPVLVTPLLHLSRWSSLVNKGRSKMKKSTTEDYAAQIDLLIDFNIEKDKFLLTFITNVLEFNRKRYYDSATCNNMTFLTESMKSLGIKTMPTICSTLNQHIGRIRPSHFVQQHNIINHQQLDNLVKDFSNRFTKDDVEYILAKYFQFHIQEWERMTRDRMSNNTWVCPVADCKCRYLEDVLKKSTSVYDMY